MTVLSLTYMGNTEWFSRLLEGDCVIDVGEHYIKQTFRNRCEIRAAAGLETLTVNVQGGAQRLAVKDVRIDYSKRWAHQHIEALRSAYGRAPFFEHYSPLFFEIIGRRHEWLYDLNRELLELALRLMKSDVTPLFSESYITDARHDFRTVRGGAAGFSGREYWQIFDGWEPNLSVVDTLMCEGPRTLELLQPTPTPVIPRRA